MREVISTCVSSREIILRLDLQCKILQSSHVIIIKKYIFHILCIVLSVDSRCGYEKALCGFAVWTVITDRGKQKGQIILSILDVTRGWIQKECTGQNTP